MGRARVSRSNFGYSGDGRRTVDGVAEADRLAFEIAARSMVHALPTTTELVAARLPRSLSRDIPAPAGLTPKQAQAWRKRRSTERGPCPYTNQVGDAKLDSEHVRFVGPGGERLRAVAKGRRVSRSGRERGLVSVRDVDRMVRDGRVSFAEVEIGAERFRVRLDRSGFPSSHRLRGFDPSSLAVEVEGADGVWSAPEPAVRRRIDRALALETLGSVAPFGSSSPQHVAEVIARALESARQVSAGPAETLGPVHVDPDDKVFGMLADFYVREALAAGHEPEQAVFLGRVRAEAYSDFRGAFPGPSEEPFRLRMLAERRLMDAANEAFAGISGPKGSGSATLRVAGAEVLSEGELSFGGQMAVSLELGRTRIDSPHVSLLTVSPLRDEEYLACPALTQLAELERRWAEGRSPEVFQRAQELMAAAEVDFPGVTLRAASWHDPLGVVDRSTLAGQLVCPDLPEGSRFVFPTDNEAAAGRDGLLRDLSFEHAADGWPALVGLAGRLVRQPALLDRSYEAQQLLGLAALNALSAAPESRVEALVRSAAPVLSGTLTRSRQSPDASPPPVAASGADAGLVPPRERLFELLQLIADQAVASDRASDDSTAVPSLESLRVELLALAGHNLAPAPRSTPKAGTSASVVEDSVIGARERRAEVVAEGQLRSWGLSW